MMENGVKAEQPLEEAPGDETPKPEQTSSKGLRKTDVLVAGLLLAIVGYFAWQLWHEFYYKGSTAHLLKLAQSDDEIERTGAILSLGRRGSEEGVIDALISGMSDESGLVRTMAVFALEKVGPAPKPVVPALIRATRDVDKNVQGASVMVLYGMGLTDKRVVHVWLDMMKNDQTENFDLIYASMALEKIIRSDPSLIAVIEPALEEMAQGYTWGLRNAIREIRQADRSAQTRPATVPTFP